MRFLHTSDWHLGRTLRNRSRDTEYNNALAEVAEIAIKEDVDCLLVAGDVFDSLSPTPDAEKLAFDFFREIRGRGIPSVLIAGNHDHPRRLAALTRLLELLHIYVRATPLRADAGGLVRVRNRDGSQLACIAALPWVPERRIVSFDSLWGEDEDRMERYEAKVASMAKRLCAEMDGEINLLLAHLMIDGVFVGPESGERQLHIGQTYAVAAQQLPNTPQFIALGHVHEAQEVRDAPVPTHYSGSLLQMDFGEAGQEKSVRIIDCPPNLPATSHKVVLTSIRQLGNIGSAKKGLTLEEIAALAGEVADAYLKVFVKVDRPLPGLAAQVRELLPNAVDIVVERADAKPEDDGRELERLTAPELFATYYRDHHQSEPRPELVALFNRLHEEVTSAAD